jgi:ribonuclease BN (tRNA processing enzyme)
VAHCQPCDVLIHEVYSPESVLSMPDYKTYRAKYHTSTGELAEIANRAKPGILVVHHVSGKGPNGPIPDEQLLREIQKTYHGKVVIGHDLEVY